MSNAIDIIREIPGGDYVIMYSGFVMLASWIVKMTPTQKDDKILGKILKFLGRFIAVNK